MDEEEYEEEYDEPTFDFCYECRGLGDDYFFDENGELVDACAECPLNPNNNRE